LHNSVRYTQCANFSNKAQLRVVWKVGTTVTEKHAASIYMKNTIPKDTSKQKCNFTGQKQSPYWETEHGC
jgi:hypothetical protein